MPTKSIYVQKQVTKTHKNIMNYVEKTYDDKHIKQEYSKRLAKIGLRWYDLIQIF